MASLKVLCLAMATVLAAAPAGASVPLTNQRTFGHSVKNGPLPAHTEVTAFEHNCSTTTTPCTITQIHVPSIYPPSGEAWNWTHGILNIYVDGEAAPSVSITLLELAGESRFNAAGDNTQSGVPGVADDGGPWGIGMMGRTARSGGVYSTVRIPFGKTVKVTIQSPPSSHGQSIYWMIVRGVEGLPVVLGDLELPASARLKIHRVDPTVMANLELVTLAEAPTGTSGALLRVNFDAFGPNFGFLEACMRLVTDGATNPIFLSSGAEDYFLSASYFDEGEFKTPNSGLTFFNEGKKQPGHPDIPATLGAYKTHDIDPVLFSNGMKLIFRRSEDTTGCGDMEHCPNQWCPPGQRSAKGCGAYEYNQAQLDADLTRRAGGLHHRTSSGASTNYSEYYLGQPGQTCTAACPTKGAGLKCNWDMHLGDIPTMLAHLNISNCLKNSTPDGMTWYAPDQPGYIPLAVNPSTGAKEVNYKQCMGFLQYPEQSDCDGQYPTNARVCRCTSSVSPAPGPPPVVYSTLVWTYEWDTAAAAAAAEAPAPSESDGLAATLKVVAELGNAGKLTQLQEDNIVDRILKGDAKLTALLNAYVGSDRLQHHLSRFLQH